MHRVVVSGSALLALAVACARAPQGAPPPLEVGAAPVVAEGRAGRERVGHDARRVGQRRHPAEGRGLPAAPALQGRAGRPAAASRCSRSTRASSAPSVEQARGALGQAEAQLAKAEHDVARFTPLAAERAISQQELDNALSAQRNAQAAVASARAAVDQSALNLAWTRVTSPIEGIAGIARAQVGDLVNAQTVMTTVSTVDPIRVTFGISEREYMRSRRQHQPRGLRDHRARARRWSWCWRRQRVPREGQGRPGRPRGRRATGTMTVRGFFPNPAQHPASRAVRARCAPRWRRARRPARAAARGDGAAGRLPRRRSWARTARRSCAR